MKVLDQWGTLFNPPFFFHNRHPLPEDLEAQFMLARLALPSTKAVDKILRYETTIERQLYRAMGQLERLQRRRKGEPTIPPIPIDIIKEE